MDSRQSFDLTIHEMKNQLAIILQAVACLKDVKNQSAGNAENTAVTLGYIGEAAEKLDKLVDNLVNSSRPKN